VQALKSGNLNNVNASEWKAARDLLGDFSHSRALRGFTSSETAAFIFSMKGPVFTLLREEFKNDAQQLAGHNNHKGS